jgi:hypothetical protein
MSDQAVRMSEIPEASNARRFGPFTSAVSATAMVALIVVMSVVIFFG